MNIQLVRRTGLIPLAFAVLVLPVSVHAIGLGSSATSTLNLTSATWSLAPVATTSASAPAGALSIVFTSSNSGRKQFYVHKNFGTVSLIGGTVSATGIPANRTVTLSTCSVAWDTTSGSSRGNCTGGTQTTIATLSAASPSASLGSVPSGSGSATDIKAVLSAGSGTVAITISVNRAQARAATNTSS
jgi:hypothetical protein